MDYRTSSVSRCQLRKMSGDFRRLFHVPQTGPFPVLDALEHVPDVFENCCVEIQDDSAFRKNVMARCVMNEDGGYTIQIRESIYIGAYEKQIGAYLGFICHELCHVYLFKNGYRPEFDRSFNDCDLPAYQSVEWQSKALCGEVMMPFEETRGKSMSRIMQEYHVSKGFAQKRQTYH